MRFTRDDRTIVGFKPCRKVAGAHAKRIAEPFEVETIEGVMQGAAGDYLMRGILGELYPCAADVFDASYAWESDEPADLEAMVDRLHHRCEKLEEERDEARMGGEFLWQLLDDIDTAEDWAKADDAAFRECARKLHRRREEVATPPRNPK